MSNSSLASFFKKASFFSSGRSGRKIEKITIHHMAGVLTAEQCGAIFQGSRQASAHYGVGKNGEIGQYVDESNTAWADGNWDSNCKSVTVETSNSSTGGDWPVSDITLASLIKLVADIAKRNNLGTLVKGKNLTWHQMYASTACPGPYLLSKMDYIVAEANKINSSGNIEPQPQPEVKPETSTSYLVRITTDCLRIRENPGTDQKIEGTIEDRGVYTIVAEANAIGASKWGKLKSGAGWISLDYTEKITSGSVPTENVSTEIKKGDKVIMNGLTDYSGKTLSTWVKGSVFDVIEVNGDRVVIGRGSVVTAAVYRKDLTKI